MMTSATPWGATPWVPIETAPRDGTVLCLSDGERMATGAWDGAGWVLFPDPDEAGDPAPGAFVPRRWMRLGFAPSLPRTLPDDVAL